MTDFTARVGVVPEPATLCWWVADSPRRLRHDDAAARDN